MQIIGFYNDLGVKKQKSVTFIDENDFKIGSM